MRVRGRRQCRDCGTEWSYFETGEPTCPHCGSLRSVGVEATRTLHTDTPATLDLSAARAALGDRPLREVAAMAERDARAYHRAKGFVDAGALRPLDRTILAAAELRFVAGDLRRRSAPSDPVEAHFLALLAGAPDGNRPDPIPDSLWSARGLAASAVVGDYRRDILAWLDTQPEPPSVRSLLGRLRTHERRIEALDGAVPPETVDHLVAAAAALGEHLRTGDTAAIERVDRHLAALDTDTSA